MFAIEFTASDNIVSIFEFLSFLCSMKLDFNLILVAPQKENVTLVFCQRHRHLIPVSQGLHVITSDLRRRPPFDDKLAFPNRVDWEKDCGSWWLEYDS